MKRTKTPMEIFQEMQQLETREEVISYLKQLEREDPEEEE